MKVFKESVFKTCYNILGFIFWLWAEIGSKRYFRPGCHRQKPVPISNDPGTGILYVPGYYYILPVWTRLWTIKTESGMAAGCLLRHRNTLGGFRYEYPRVSGKRST